MPEGQAEDIKIPSAASAIVGQFADRGAADTAMERLARAGFEEDQVSFIARGAEHVGDKFVPGALLITVHPEGREDEAMKVLKECGATRIDTGAVSAIGEVTEIGHEEREEATSS